MKIYDANVDKVIEAFAEIEEIAERYGCSVWLDRNIGRIGLYWPAEGCAKTREEIREVFGERGSG